MTSLLLSLTFCLALSPTQLDVATVCTPDGSVELSDPVTLRWPVVLLSDRDAEKVGAREWRIVDVPGPVEPAAFPCGVCVVGQSYAPPGYKPICYLTAPEGPMCLRCGKPCGKEPTPIACGEPPSGRSDAR